MVRSSTDTYSYPRNPPMTGDLALAEVTLKTEVGLGEVSVKGVLVE